MFRFLCKNKKGFTLIELVVVLLLLSFGVLALANMFKVTYRAFQKAEERSIKQEAVKTVAELLRSGSTNVAAAQAADIFDTTEIVPTKNAIDKGFSYLYVEPHKCCSVCGGDWDEDANECLNATPCSEAVGSVDGSFIYILNKEQKRENALQLSDVPIYVDMRIFEEPSYVGGAIENQCGVVITLAALEDDYDYASGNIPTSDEIYYSLDVAYHFPNIVTSGTDATVNYPNKGQLSSANRYNSEGQTTGSVYAAECHASVDEHGKFTYYKCSDSNENHQPCGCTKVDKDHFCYECDCMCDKKQATVLRVYADSIISSDNVNTSIAIPTLCFIATASYGQDSGEVGLLCKFRDECLLTNPLGTAFVNAYYKLSPPIAEFISDSEPLKAAVRFGLKPLVAIATNALDEEAASQNAPWFIMFMLCGAGATATLIKVDKRRKKAKE